MINIKDQVDKHLYPYREKIGGMYEGYRNHVCRVVENCKVLDTDPDNLGKYIIAGVFHDIGIWTHATIDYLAPSILVAEEYLKQNHPDFAGMEITRMINWHHKTTAYSGDFQKTVNVFRKADWIDVTFGLISFGVDHGTLKYNRYKYPDHGFHSFLLRKTFGNVLRHPLRPLPMFRL